MATKTAQKNVELISAVKFMIIKAYEAIMHDDFELIITSDFTKLRAFDMDIYVTASHCHVIAGAVEIYHDDKKTRIGVFYYKAADFNVDVEYVDAPELRETMTKLCEVAIKRIRDRLEKALRDYQ